MKLFIIFCLFFQVGNSQDTALTEIGLDDEFPAKSGYTLKYQQPADDDDSINEAPIIGILSQEISYHLNSKWPGVYKSFIAASYVKFVEGGGARVIPIWIDKPKDYYVEIMSKINGVLLPGGATWFNQSHGYADAGEIIYQHAKDLYDAGDYFPIWGTCLGFELLTYLDANRNEHRDNCASESQGLNLDFKSGNFYYVFQSFCS